MELFILLFMIQAIRNTSLFKCQLQVALNWWPKSTIWFFNHQVSSPYLLSYPWTQSTICKYNFFFCIRGNSLSIMHEKVNPLFGKINSYFPFCLQWYFLNTQREATFRNADGRDFKKMEHFWRTKYNHRAFRTFKFPSSTIHLIQPSQYLMNYPSVLFLIKFISIKSFTHSFELLKQKRKIKSVGNFCNKLCFFSMNFPWHLFRKISAYTKMR
jgi:hypothetical protein